MGLEASGRLFLFEEGLLQSTSTSEEVKKNQRRWERVRALETTSPLPEGRSADGAVTHRLIDPSMDYFRAGATDSPMTLVS